MPTPTPTPASNALDVWLRFPDTDTVDHDETEAEANVYPTPDGEYRVEWYLTAVGLVKSKTFPTYDAAAAWLVSEGFLDFSA